MIPLDEDRFHRLVRGETRGALATLGRGGLTIAGWAFAIAASARNLAFDAGLAKAESASFPIVSIGNLTLGGTGKTPMVEYTARWYLNRRLRVAVLSRGYGGGDGLNDEGMVLRQNLPEAAQLQGRDRVALAASAAERFDAQIAVLDDGFQHRRLKRDLDIVLLDALAPFGLDRLFPRGLLREPIASLRRADAVVLSRADLVPRSRAEAIRARVEHAAGKRVWIEARQTPIAWIDANRRTFPPDGLSAKRVAAFCGIGNPEGFRKTLESLRIDPIGFRAYPDHHAYGESDREELRRWSESLSCELLLTTQKDLVKLPIATIGAIPVFALRIGFEPLSDPTPLETAFARLLPRDRGGS